MKTAIAAPHCVQIRQTKSDQYLHCYCRLKLNSNKLSLTMVMNEFTYTLQDINIFTGH